MKLTWISRISVALLGFHATMSFAADPNPMGTWKRGDGNAQIRIAPCGSKICAVNTWIGDPNSGEKVGDILVMTLKPTSETELDGEAYDKRRDITYSMRMIVQQSKLSTHGCILAGIICKSATWTRVQ